MEKVMRSSTTGGSEIRGLGWEISSSESPRSSDGGLVRGGTLGGTSRQRPTPTEARREPQTSRARCVFFITPPGEPLSDMGEPAGE